MNIYIILLAFALIIIFMYYDTKENFEDGDDDVCYDKTTKKFEFNKGNINAENLPGNLIIDCETGYLTKVKHTNANEDGKDVYYVEYSCCEVNDTEENIKYTKWDNKNSINKQIWDIQHFEDEVKEVTYNSFIPQLTAKTEESVKDANINAFVKKIEIEINDKKQYRSKITYGKIYDNFIESSVKSFSTGNKNIKQGNTNIGTLGNFFDLECPTGNAIYNMFFTDWGNSKKSFTIKCMEPPNTDIGFSDEIKEIVEESGADEKISTDDDAINEVLISKGLMADPNDTSSKVSSSFDFNFNSTSTYVAGGIVVFVILGMFMVRSKNSGGDFGRQRTPFYKRFKNPFKNIRNPFKKKEIEFEEYSE